MKLTKLTYREAVRAGLREVLANDPRVFLMGEDARLRMLPAALADPYSVFIFEHANILGRRSYGHTSQRIFH